VPSIEINRREPESPCHQCIALGAFSQTAGAHAALEPFLAGPRWSGSWWNNLETPGGLRNVARPRLATRAFDSPINLAVPGPSRSATRPVRPHADAEACWKTCRPHSV